MSLFGEYFRTELAEVVWDRQVAFYWVVDVASQR